MTIIIDAASRSVLAKIKNLDKSFPKNIRRGLYNAGKQLKQTASKNILTKGRSGKVYKIKGRRHTSSSPGESWANLTGIARSGGKSRKGIVYSVKGSRQLIFGNDVPYVKFLEFGTKNMAPRPAHLISLNQNQRNIENILIAKTKESF